MRLAKKENNKIIELENISSITGFDNSQLILMERGDNLKKRLKKARFMFGNKNLFSVKSIKDALAEDSIKESKKRKVNGTWCCVCCEIWTSSPDGICNECHI